MRRRIPIAVALATVLMVAIGGMARLGAITYGWLDYNDHPNVGALLVKLTNGPSVYRVCSGTLIAERVFLTASHCTYSLDGLATAGRLDWVGVSFATAAPHNVVYKGVHHTNPAYPGIGTDTGDVAVVVLNDAPGLEAARLPASGMFDAWYGTSRRAVKDLKFTAVGYGSLGFEYGGGPPTSISSFGSRYAAHSSFAAMDKVWLHLLANEATGDGGTCYGDSGGPNFVWQGGRETDIIAGVTVKGDAMCVATNVIYRLDIPTARAFLGQYVDLPD